MIAAALILIGVLLALLIVVAHVTGKRAEARGRAGGLLKVRITADTRRLITAVHAGTAQAMKLNTMWVIPEPEYGVRPGHLERLQHLVDRVDYRDDTYRFRIGTTPGMSYPFLQVQHLRPDAHIGVLSWGAGGKAYITPNATDSEIFQTMLGLAKSYEEHEVREFFRVDGKRVFGPHIATEALATIADQVDVRQPEPPEDVQ